MRKKEKNNSYGLKKLAGIIFIIPVCLVMSIFPACNKPEPDPLEEEVIAWEKDTFPQYDMDGYYEEDQILLPRFSHSFAGFAEVDGRQGVAWENGMYYVSGTGSLWKYNAHWRQAGVNKFPFREIPDSVNHIGDIDVYNGEIYAAVEYFNAGSSKNPMVAIYDAKTLKFKRSFPIDASSGQTEISGVTVDYDNRIIWTCCWTQGECGRYLYKYDLLSKRYLGKVQLQAMPSQVQGIAYYDGWIYLSADDGDADLKEPDHVYRCQVDLSKSAFRVGMEQEISDMTMLGELEGITFDKVNLRMVVMYNYGIRIQLGKSYGFYPGFDREIHEVYTYDLKKKIRPIDYSASVNWVEKPGTLSHDADVFMILPAVDAHNTKRGNEDITNNHTVGLFRKTLNMEKGIVDGSADIYAPLYRQATIGCYIQDDGYASDRSDSVSGGAGYADLAYSDVRSAWNYYAKNDNNSRPVILFGYGEGGDMALRLLKDFGDEGILKERLAAAYIIGTGVTEEDLSKYPYLQMAGGEEDTGVIVSFTAMNPDAAMLLSKEYAINPLNWKTDNTAAGKRLNKGCVRVSSLGIVTDIYPNFCGAYLDEASGRLIVTNMENSDAVIRKEEGYYPPGDYTAYDLMLFYRNLEENVGKRIHAFLAQ